MSARRERAIHEAGHAVAAHLAEKRVELVSVAPTGRLGGFCMFLEWTDPTFSLAEVAAGARLAAADMGSRPAPRDYPAEELERRLLIALAGPEAQRKYTHGRWSPPGDEFDMEKARELLGAGRRSMAAVCWDLSQARARAQEFLQTHWSAVEFVAGALECSGTLTGDQVRLLIQYAPGSQPAEATVASPVVQEPEPRRHPARGGTSAALRLRGPRFGPFLTVHA